MRAIKLLCLFPLLFLLLPFNGMALKLELPEHPISGVEYTIPVKQTGAKEITINGKPFSVAQRDGEEIIMYTFESGKQFLTVEGSSAKIIHEVNAVPLWLSAIPPLLAIILALLTREVLTSLFLGIFSGTAILGWYSDGFTGLFSGFLDIFQTKIIDALADRGHLSIVVFSMTIGAVVALISKNGGMQGVVNYIGKYAKDAKSGQLATYTLGLAIFFDDYANTLVVGNTMRAVTDRLKISREKLAYLVDSTAAPIAALAFVTTWIGAELGYIEEGIARIPGFEEGAYSVFLNSLAYSFYPILTLLFILMLILQGKDFGPMFKAEQQARAGIADAENEVGPDDAELALFSVDEGTPVRAFNAVIPISIIIIGTLAGLVYTGYNEEVWLSDANVFRKISMIIGNSDSYIALLWASSAGLAAAILLTVSQRILSLERTMNVVISGYKTMVTAMLILVLAWSLAGVTESMETATFLKGLWHESMSPVWLPAITFILSALVSFSTGSSWGSMAILYPLLLPTSFSIGLDAGYEVSAILPLFYNVVSSVLAGSVLGDHCSPISDTTILSSLASGCNHIDHVRTQLPYALTVGGVSITLGTIGTSMGISPWIAFFMAVPTLWLLVKFLGKNPGKNYL
jgi:Na+/H+ antiporter NhaC